MDFQPSSPSSYFSPVKSESQKNVELFYFDMMTLLSVGGGQGLDQYPREKVKDNNGVTVTYPINLLKSSCKEEKLAST